MSQPWHDPQQPKPPSGSQPLPGAPYGPPRGAPSSPPQGPYGQQQAPYGPPPPWPPGAPYGQASAPPYAHPGGQAWNGTPQGPAPAAYGGPPTGQAPLGQQPLPADDIGRYAPPRQTGPILAVVAGVLVLVAVVVAGLALQNPLVPAPTPTATPTAGASALPGHPFQMPNNARATGRWEVLGREWLDEGVLVQVRVACDTDVCSYGFTSFSNQGNSSVDPAPSPRQPQIGRGSLQAGQSASGYLFLPLPRGAATLILTTSAGRQVSALPIDA